MEKKNLVKYILFSLIVCGCANNHGVLNAGKLIRLDKTINKLPWGQWTTDSLLGKQFRFPDRLHIKYIQNFSPQLFEQEKYENASFTLLSIKHILTTDSLCSITIRIDSTNEMKMFDADFRKFYSFFIPITDLERAKLLWVGKRLWVNASYSSSNLVPFEEVVPIDISKSSIGTLAFEFKLKHSDSSVSNFSCTLFSFDSSISNEPSFNNVFIEKEPSSVWKTENVQLNNIFTLPWEVDTATFINYLTSSGYKYSRFNRPSISYQNPHLALTLEPNSVDGISFNHAILFFPFGKFQSAILSISNEKYESIHKLLIARYGEPTDSSGNGRLKEIKWLFYVPGKSCRLIELKQGSVASGSPEESAVIFSDLKSPFQKQ